MQDLLAHVVFDALTVGGVEKLKHVCEEIALCKSQLREMEDELFKKLPKEGREDTYWLCTEKITQIVTEKNGVCTQQYIHLSKVYMYNDCVYKTAFIVSCLVF